MGTRETPGAGQTASQQRQRTAAEPAANESNAQSTSPWKVITEVLGVLGGVATFLTFVGGLAFAARLAALDLPIDASVALLPVSSLLVSGIRALAVGLVLAAAVALVAVIAALRSTDDQPSSRTGLGVLTCLALAFLVGWPFLTEPLSTFQDTLLVIGGLVAVGMALAIIRRASSVRVVAYGLSALVLFSAALIHGFQEALPPTQLDYVGVRMESGDVTDGFYLASDGNSVYLAPNVGRHAIGVVTALPRSDINAIRIERHEEKAEGLDDELPAARVGRYATRPTLSGERKRQRDALLRDAARIRADDGWVYPPVLPVASLEFLLDHFETFVGWNLHKVPTPKSELYDVPLQALLEDPQLHAGRPMVTTGVIVQAAPFDQFGRDLQRSVLVVKPDGRSQHEAYCDVTTRERDRLRAGRRVKLHAVVRAWGSFNTRAGPAVGETQLACAAAELI